MSIAVCNQTAEDGVHQYLQEIRSIPMLSEREERELALCCAKGDEDAIRRLVSANLRLVVSVAREYAGRGVPMLDLIQEGSLGLLAAAKKFDPELGFRFSTYAIISNCFFKCFFINKEIINSFFFAISWMSSCH